MKCPYCESQTIRQDHIFYCEFCEITIMDQVKVPVIREELYLEDLHKSIKELMDYHTYDLLWLLRHTREERRTAFDLYQTVKKAKHIDLSFQKATKEGLKQYLYWTKKAKALENLLLKRLGFIPTAVTDKLLNKYHEIQNIA